MNARPEPDLESRRAEDDEATATRSATPLVGQDDEAVLPDEPPPSPAPDVDVVEAELIRPIPVPPVAEEDQLVADDEPVEGIELVPRDEPVEEAELEPEGEPVEEAEEPAPAAWIADQAGFRARWDAIQLGFVDQPREAVHDADALVGQVVDELTVALANARASIAEGWEADADLSTEDLRTAFRNYRDLFDRTLRAV